MQDGALQSFCSPFFSVSRLETPFIDTNQKENLQTNSSHLTLLPLKALSELWCPVQKTAAAQRRESEEPTLKLPLSSSQTVRAQSTCNDPSVKKDVLQQASDGIYHTQHTVKPVAAEQTPCSPSTATHCQMVHSAGFPSRPTLTPGVNEAGRSSLAIKTPRGHNSLYKFESVHFMQTWTNPPQKQTGHHSTQNYIVYLITQLSQVSTPIPLIYFPDDRSRREGIKAQECGEAVLTTLAHMTAEVLTERQGLYRVPFFPPFRKIDMMSLEKGRTTYSSPFSFQANIGSFQPRPQLQDGGVQKTKGLCVCVPRMAEAVT